MNDSYEQHEHIEDLKTVGGPPCLDFANTVSRRDTDEPNERLFTYAHLVAWAEHVALLTSDEGAELLAASEAQPAEAEAVFTRAIALREALFRIFARNAGGETPDAADLAILNKEIAGCYAFLRLVTSGPGFVWRWEYDAARLDRILWPVVDSAAELLTSGDLDRVRVCAGEHCGWLFVDRSKNRSRRWCDMQECGNVAKVRRYRRRHKEG